MNNLNNILKGKLFGHPIHMMLVHFPAALFPLSAAFALISFLLHNSELALFNFYIICSGSGMGWLALIFGVIELLQIQEMKAPFKIALIHGGLNSLWVSVFTILAGAQFKFYPIIPLPSLTQVIIEIVVVLMMLYSNFLGGELVLKHGVGKKL
jgi:uncharacterized membrane protein